MIIEIPFSNRLAKMMYLCSIQSSHNSFQLTPQMIQL